MRLSKLQKTIIAVLGVMDNNDWEGWYSKHQPQNKPPYWHRVRREFFDSDGSGYKSHFEDGVKGYVEKMILKQKGFKSYTDIGDKTNYFNTPSDKQRFYYIGDYKIPIAYGASSFSVSFSRSLKGLLEKGLINAKKVGTFKKHLAEVKLIVNNPGV